jgi:hypothetical protein
MKRRGSIIAVAALTIAWQWLPCALAHDPASEIKTYRDALPRIAVKLGDTFDTVKKNSTFDFSNSVFLGSGTIIETPHVFVYSHPQRSFEISLAKYLGLTFHDSSKTATMALSLSPHDGTLELSDFWKLFKDLVERFDRAGWARDRRYRLYESAQFADKSYQEFIAEFADKPFQIGGRANIAFWRTDRELLRISIVKVYARGEPYSTAMGATVDRFNLIVDIERDLASR